MKVAFNPSINYPRNFKSQTIPVGEKDTSNKKLKPDEVATKKIKRSISELTYVVLGVIIVYFAMKRNIKNNKLKNYVNRLENLAKLDVPHKEKLSNIEISNFL